MTVTLLQDLKLSNHVPKWFRKIYLFNLTHIAVTWAQVSKHRFLDLRHEIFITYIHYKLQNPIYIHIYTVQSQNMYNKVQLLYRPTFLQLQQ